MKPVRVILLNEADLEYKKLNEIVGKQISEGKQNTDEIQLLKSIKQNTIIFPFETSPSKLIKDKNLLEKIQNQNSIRIMPYLSQTQGFFVCILYPKYSSLQLPNSILSSNYLTKSCQTRAK